MPPGKGRWHERLVNSRFSESSKLKWHTPSQMGGTIMIQLCFGFSVVLFALYAWNREQPR